MHRFLAALSLVLSLIATGYDDTIVSRDFTPGNNYININSPEGILGPRPALMTMSLSPVSSLAWVCPVALAQST